MSEPVSHERLRGKRRWYAPEVVIIQRFTLNPVLWIDGSAFGTFKLCADGFKSCADGFKSCADGFKSCADGFKSCADKT